jgi:hypothetical protein
MAAVPATRLEVGGMAAEPVVQAHDPSPGEWRRRASAAGSLGTAWMTGVMAGLPDD